jgi:replicative DNA helicase
LFVSPAMSGSEVAQRVMSLSSGIKMEKISSGNLDINDLHVLENLVTNGSPLLTHLQVLDSPLIGVKDIRKLLHKQQEKDRPCILVIDDVLELVTKDKRGSMKRMTKMMFQLMELAQNFEIPVLICAGLSSKSHFTSSRDLKKDGIAQQFASAIIFLSRAKAYFPRTGESEIVRGQINLVVLKNQIGKLGAILLKDELTIQRVTTYSN